MWPGMDTRLTAALTDLRDQRGPLYSALADRLQLLIADGRMPVGARLPSERDLSRATGLSRATVTAAYRHLVDLGWAQARVGAGTWTRLPGAAREGAALVPGPPTAGLLDLAHAAPSAPPQVHAAFAAALEELPRYLSGHGYFPAGLPELRRAIAVRYTERGLPTDPDQIVVTAGALHAVTLALRTLVGSGDRVLVEQPSYPHALDAVDDTGATAVPVSLDPDRLDDFAADLHRATRQTAPRAAYLMPDYQNPTGALAPAQVRRRVAAALQQAGTVTVVDESLVEMGLDGAPPEPFAVHTRPGLAVSVGTMSKCVWGGLRVGWLRADHDTARRLAAAVTREQVAGPVLEQLAVQHLFEVLEDVQAFQRERLRTQRDALVDALARRLPDWRVRVPAGGLVLWCELPAPVSSALVARAHEHRLRLAAGPRFGIGPACEDRLRLPFAQPVETLREAVEVLAVVSREVTPRSASGAGPRLVL
jgi:DNA-binding transcriptional MocR family regulator